MFTWLFGDRGIPASYRHMDGFSSHTYQWVNGSGERVWVKVHCKTDQGIRCLTSSEAAELAGLNPDSHQLDLVESIDRGELPSWTVNVQVMTEAAAATARVNPFDLTRVWSQKDFPLHEVGRLTLDRNPDNYFADVEQVGFDPGNFVPGIGPSPDKMLQGRLFAYGDAHRYRLGINHTQLPVNAPHATEAHNYGRDGLMAGGSNGGRARNYEPNSFDGPTETDVPYAAGLALSGTTGTFDWDQRQTNDFAQAGDLYRLQPPEAQARLVDNIAGGLGAVSPGPIGDGIVERSIAHFAAADPEFGEQISRGVKERRS
jgi:catalase